MANGTVFATVKAMLPVSGDAYDGEIVTQIKAAVLDLTKTAEIVLPGEVDITRTHQAATTSEPEQWVITDSSTLTDELAITAIATWCNMRIGNPPNYDNLLKAYESLKGQMRLSRYYSGTGEAEECGS